MGIVRTVLGDVDSSVLGYTLAHEHVFSNFGGREGEETNATLMNWEKQLQIVTDFKNDGGGCLVDSAARPIDGRWVAKLKAMSETTGVHIIAATGVPFDRPGGTKKDGSKTVCPEADLSVAFRGKSIDDIADFYVSEIEEGMDGTKVKAGWILAGTSYMHITTGEEMALRAACRAAKRTGAAVHTHAKGGSFALEQLEIVKDEGLNLSQFGILHMDRNPDYYLHKRLLDEGVYLIYDGPGKVKYNIPDCDRIDLMKKLIADGYQTRIMLCNDMGKKTHHPQYGYGPGLNWIKDKFLPRLLEEGISQEVIDDFQINNPARFYSLREIEKG